MWQESEALAALQARYSAAAYYLHSDCLYDGDCEPEEFIVELIHASSDYINEAERLADGQNP